MYREQVRFTAKVPRNENIPRKYREITYNVFTKIFIRRNYVSSTADQLHLPRWGRKSTAKVPQVPRKYRGYREYREFAGLSRYAVLFQWTYEREGFFVICCASSFEYSSNVLIVEFSSTISYANFTSLPLRTFESL